MDKRRVRILIGGKVQGVFFRQALKVMAKKNNVFGWVKNLEDKRVEALLEGNTENINSVVEWARIGPAHSRVDNIEINDEQFKNEFSIFEVLY